MKKFLIELLVLIVAFALLWLFAGRQISKLVDRFATVPLESKSVDIVTYQGSGDTGFLIFRDFQFNLVPLNPHVGSTKDSELAISYAGKVFAFGPIRTEADLLHGDVPKTDRAVVSRRWSYVPWLTLDSDWKPHLNRENYFEFSCKKSNGTKLNMRWAVTGPYEWTTLTRIEISNPAK